MASTWTLATIAGLWTYEAHRPEAHRPEAARSVAARERAVAFSLRAVLIPPATIVAAALGVATVVTLARPHAVLGYARLHPAFVVGAAAIAVAAFVCASGLNLVLRRPA